jgi:hypothetical protein
MLRLMKAMIVVVGLLSLVACQSPTSTTQTDIEVTASPNPTTAVQSTGKTYTITYDTKPNETFEYEYRTSFTVTLKNSSKVGSKISSINLTVNPASGGIIVTPTTGETAHYDYLTSASANRVEGNNATATIGFDVWYTVPGHGREALVTVGFSFLNDDDVTLSSSVSVRVAP